jgi:hypothetical protein
MKTAPHCSSCSCPAAAAEWVMPVVVWAVREVLLPLAAAGAAALGGGPSASTGRVRELLLSSQFPQPGYPLPPQKLPAAGGSTRLLSDGRSPWGHTPTRAPKKVLQQQQQQERQCQCQCTAPCSTCCCQATPRCTTLPLLPGSVCHESTVPAASNKSLLLLLLLLPTLVFVQPGSKSVCPVEAPGACGVPLQPQASSRPCSIT